MPTSVAVITGVYGDYDVIRQGDSKRHPEVDYLLFTDDPTVGAHGWETVLDQGHPDYHPRLAAKWPKMLQHDRLRRYDSVVWIDGCFTIESANFPMFALGQAGGGFAQFSHPFRDCIYAEAHVCGFMEKYRDVPMLKQVDHYRTEGHPAHYGLWATGVIAWGDAGSWRQFGGQWLVECLDWTVQDQLSEPVVLRRMGLRPATIPGNIYGNKWLKWHGHKWEDETGRRREVAQ